MSEAEVLISDYVSIFFPVFLLMARTQRGRRRARKSKKSQTYFDPR